MALDKFSYTGLTHQDILDDIKSRFNTDPRFKNLSESDIIQFLLEIFSGTTDLTNYYIERTAEEMFLQTARNESSVIAKAVEELNYVPKRPIPATAKVKMVLNGPLNLTAGSKIILNRYNKFSYNGNSFIPAKEYEYVFTDYDVAYSNSKNWKKEIEFSLIDKDGKLTDGAVPAANLEPVYFTQLELKKQVFSGDDFTDILNTNFQSFTINDKKFSNLYGSEDVSYNPRSNDPTELFNLDVGYTRVYVTDDINSIPNGNEPEDSQKGFFQIERFSIIENLNFLSKVRSYQTSKAKAVRVCRIKTNTDKTVDVQFGDNTRFIIPLQNKKDNLVVEYTVTEGASVNELGTLGKPLAIDGPIKAGNKDVSENVKFYFNGNITGGADFESIESIKMNAPGAFASRDRLISRQDYLTFFRSLTSPSSFKNVLVWGENEIAKMLNKSDSNNDDIGIKMQALMNIIFVVLLDSCYSFTDGEIGPKSFNAIQNPANIFTNTKFDFGGEYLRECLENPNVILQNQATNRHFEMNSIVDKLSLKSQMTTQHILVPPIPHFFKLTGTVYLNQLEDIPTTREKIRVALYEYFDQNVNFNTPVRISNVIKFVEEFTEVKYCNLKFSPTPSSEIFPDATSTGISVREFDYWFTGNQPATNRKHSSYLIADTLIDDKTGDITEYSMEQEIAVFNVEELEFKYDNR